MKCKHYIYLMASLGCFVIVTTSEGQGGRCECRTDQLSCFSDRDISPKYQTRSGRLASLENVDEIEEICPRVVVVKLLHLNNQQVQRFISLSLAKVYFLEVSYSKILNVTENMFFKAPKLKELTLVENKIYSLPENTFMNIPKLKLLNLNGNKLKALNRTNFNHLDHLRELHLRENKIANIEDLTFEHLHHLRPGVNTLHKQEICQSKLYFL